MKSDSNQTKYELVADRLRSARRILAATHLNPDGDALGSLSFFKQLCDKLGKECVIYCAGPMPESLEFLPSFALIENNIAHLDFSSFDLLVTLDCGSPERSNIATELFRRSAKQTYIEIDHHPSKSSADIELRVIEAASTTQILFVLAKTLGVEVDSPMAKALLTGIVTDTASFIHPTATNETISAAAAILGRGASLAKINDQTSRTKSLAALKVWGKALARLTRSKTYNIVYTFITEQDIEESGDEEAVEGISGFLSSIEDADAVLVLREKNGEIRGSLRTTKDTVDLNRLARALGGGGHRRASGFSLQGRLVCENERWQVEYR